MKWTNKLQIESEVMAACGIRLKDISHFLGVGATSVRCHLIMGEAEKIKLASKAYYRLKKEKINASCKARYWANKEAFDARSRAYGRSRPERNVWRSMIRRCHSPSDSSFARYGGRGISVCRRWLESYEEFIADVGIRPSPKHSLDRIDNNGDYEPGNCRWVTAKEQARNRHNTAWVKLDGEIMPLSQALECLKESRTSAVRWLNKGTHPRMEKVSTQPEPKV